MYLGKEVICSKMKHRRVWTHDHFMAARANIITNIKQVLSASVDFGNLVNQLNSRRQQQHRGSEAVKLWAEIWNFTRESWSGIPDFCLKLLCLTA